MKNTGLSGVFFANTMFTISNKKTLTLRIIIAYNYK